MLLTIFQGSKPTAASTTPTRIDSRISRNATVSGEPPRKRYRPSLAAGNSRVSFGISMISPIRSRTIVRVGEMGNPHLAVNGRQPRLPVLTRFLHANRCPPQIKVQGHASLENAMPAE